MPDAPTDPVTPAATGIDDRLAAAWRGHLGQELAAHRDLLASGEAKTQALIANDHERLLAALTQEQQRGEVVAQLRLRRERLRAITARELDRPADGLRLGAVVAAAPESHRAPLSELENEIRMVAERLQRVTERNLLLVRSGLGILDEVLGLLTGASAAAPGYGPERRRPPSAGPAGSFCSFEA